MENEFSSRIVTANGQRIHLVEAGRGPLVLFVHGFPETWYSWRHQLRALGEAGYRAVAIDQRGYGRSSKPSQVHEYRITELVADLVGVVQALGEQTATVVGHDWGAPPAWTAAWTRPDVFTAVVGLSVPFAGRSVPLPGSPFGERRPSEVARWIAGEDLVFYHEHFNVPGLAEREFEKDADGWMRAVLFSLSALPPAPPELASLDLSQLSDEDIAGVIRSTPILTSAVDLRF